MKFLIKTMGWERWHDEVLAALAQVRAEGGAALPFDPDSAPVEAAPAWRPEDPPTREEVTATVAATSVAGPGLPPSVRRSRDDEAALTAWRQTNVHPQRQPGYVVALVRLVLGDVTAGQLRVLASLARAFGDGTVRLTPDQNLFIRWVREDAVPALFARLAAAGLGEAGASTIGDVTSCPGAESCKLAVTQSRGLGRVLTEALAGQPELAQIAADASVKISGCPNGCGQHHIATIGFQGSVRKVNGRAVPQYFVMVGGAATGEGATFARLAAKVPARRVASAVERLLAWYQRDRRDGESAPQFFGRAPVAAVKALLADLESFDAEHAAPEDYIDLGETQTFTPEVMEGECAT
jgi:sulfite reductase (NADPH) hemoprotein beta-component